MTDLATPHPVRILVRFPTTAEGAVPGSILHVRIRDNSSADRINRDVGAADIVLAGGEKSKLVTVNMDQSVGQSRASYGIFVHADGSGSGLVEIGDFVSAEMITVPDDFEANALEVDLTRVD